MLIRNIFSHVFYEKLIRENVLTFALLHDIFGASTRTRSALAWPSNYYYYYCVSATKGTKETRMRPIFVIYVFRTDIRLCGTRDTYYNRKHGRRKVPKSGLHGRMLDTNKIVFDKKEKKRKEEKVAKTFLISSRRRRRAILSREMS